MDNPHIDNFKSEYFELPPNNSNVPSCNSGLYPEINNGGLVKLVQAMLEANGVSLPVRETSVALGAVVSNNTRFCQIHKAAKERLFLTDFWENGVLLANVHTQSTDVLLRAIIAWCHSTVNPLEFSEISKEIELNENLEPYVKGPLAYVRFKWENLVKLADQYPNPYGKLKPVIEKAMNTSELGSLLPYTSMWLLCFSQCTGYPFIGGCPQICPAENSEFKTLYFGRTSTVLGQGTAEHAVAIAIQHLPPNCGPARHGTAVTLTMKPT